MNNEDDNDILILGSFAVILLSIGLYVHFKKKPSIQNSNIQMVNQNKIVKHGDIIVSLPETKMDSYPALIVFGGLSFATSQFMYDTMPKDMLYKAIVVFANYNTDFKLVEGTLNALAAENKMAISSLSLFGFSAGGRKVWQNASPRFKWIGGIDPSTYATDAVKAAPNIIMAFNPANWAGGSYPTITAGLPVVAAAVAKAGGIVEQPKLAHKNFPAYFWDKYKQQILA